MESIALLMTIVALLVFVYKREEDNKIERQDLMDRLMAKDFQEYKEATQPLVTFEPISTTEEEEFWREIEAKKV